jgi:hypothetical protein
MAERIEAARLPDRVRAHTNDRINERIDRETLERVGTTAAAGPAAIAARLEELDREWDVERYLEANAASLAFIGVLLGAFHSTWWLLLPAVVTIFLFQHAVQGWCPPLGIFRRRGIRTRKEIDAEVIALKALRRDFDSVTDPVTALRAASG